MNAARYIAAVSVAAVAAIVAGCGGSAPLSQQELIAKGDELCRAGQQSFAEVQAEPVTGFPDAVVQTGRLIDSATDELDGLRDLKPPDELSGTYARYLDAKQQALDLLHDGRDAADNDDDNRYGQLQVKVAGTAGLRAKLAREIGFKNCSQPKGGPALPAKPAQKPAPKPAR